MDRIIEALNDAQQRAVTSPSDVVQVLAPPGSGKTKTLTARVAYLITNHGYKPWNIIVCTFTNKAAREMKERIKGFLGDNLEKRLVLGTFHAIALRYLRSYGHYIGIRKDFGIADSADTLAILKRIRQRRKLNIEPGVARSRISKVKAKSTAVQPFKGSEKQEFDTIFEEYEETLRTSNLLDYDDLLVRCTDLLRDHRDCVSNVEAVLIDEFQDTNHVQYELMLLFSQQRQRITIVGDPDQSIYAFRSAEVKNVLRMQKQYPETHVVYLEENYRSSGAILMSALGVIEQDESRPPKKLLPTHSVGEQPVLRRLPHPKAEGSWIVGELKRIKLLTGDLLTYNDFAILLRSGHQSQTIELALGKAGVPYRVVGGHKFFDRWEIKLLLNYLRVIGTPQHNDAVIHVINEPSRGVGDETVKKLVEEAEQRKITLWQLLKNIAQERGKVETKVRTAQRKGICEFFGLIVKAQNKLSTARGSDIVVDLLDFLISRLSFLEHLRKKYGEEADSRLENVEELRVQAMQLCSQSHAKDADAESLPVIEGVEQTMDEGSAAVLSDFLANVALATDLQTAEEGQAVNQVTISTMHGAKGLEWPVVFVASLYDGSMPHSRAEDHDEERRLLYVAMTRAQALLYLSCPIKNSGGSDSNHAVLSPFLSSRSMSPLFELKGPSVTFSMAQHLARILRRTCPTEVKLVEAFRMAETCEDEYWPTDGGDPNRKDEDWFPIPRTAAETSTFPHKRRRVDAGYESGSTANVNSFTTMQNFPAFSMASTTLPATFISASSCLKQQNESKEVMKTAQISQTVKSKTVMTKKTTSSKLASTQGSLYSFFDKQSDHRNATKEHKITIEEANENKRPEPVEGYESSTIDFKPASTMHVTSMSILKPSVKTLGMRRQPLLASKVNRPFKPLSRPHG